MLEKYYRYKINYRDYIIFIKSGIFYECIGNDALIMNNLFNYKLKKISNNLKVGFPIKNVDSVISKLKENDINYLIIDKDICDKYSSDNNRYNEYEFDLEKIFYNYLRIEKITKYLEDNIMNDDILGEFIKNTKLF